MTEEECPNTIECCPEPIFASLEEEECLFWNAECSYVAECPEGYEGESVSVIMDAGTVCGDTQEEADELAWEQVFEAATDALECSPSDPREECVELCLGTWTAARDGLIPMMTSTVTPPPWATASSSNTGNSHRPMSKNYYGSYSARNLILTMEPDNTAWVQFKADASYEVQCFWLVAYFDKVDTPVTRLIISASHDGLVWVDQYDSGTINHIYTPGDPSYWNCFTPKVLYWGLAFWDEIAPTDAFQYWRFKISWALSESLIINQLQVNVCEEEPV